MIFRCLSKLAVSSLILISSCAHSINDFYEQAAQSFNEGKYEASFIYLKNALEQDPRHLPAKILMGKIYLHKAVFNSAIKEFEEAIDYNVDMNLILSDYATALIFAKRYKEVLTFAEGYRLSTDSQYELYLKKAVAYQNLGLTLLARKSYESAIALKPKIIRAINSYAAFELQNGDIQKAEELAKRSLSLNDFDNRTWHLLGTVYLAQDNLQKAIDSFEHSLVILDQDPIVRRSLVRAYIQAERLDDAKNLIDNILIATPNDPHMMLMSSWLLSKQKNDEKSAEMLESVATTTSLISEDEFTNEPSLIFVKGVSSYLLGQEEQAVKDLNKYLALEAGDTRAISLLAEVYIKLGKESEAEYLLERYESSVMSDKPLGLRLVDLYVKSGKRFDAERLLSQMRNSFPDDIDIMLRQVELLNKAGRKAEASRLIEEIEKSGTNSGWRLALAKALMSMQSNDFEAANSMIEELIQQFPDNPDLLNFKVSILIKSNQPVTAEELARRVLMQTPDFFEAKYNLATALKMQDKVTDALPIAKELSELRPENNEVKLLLAQLYLNVREVESAVPLLESISTGAVGQRSKEILFDIYYNNEEYQNALRVIRSLNEIDLYNINYLFKHVSVLAQLNRIENAKQQLGIIFGLAENNLGLLTEVAITQRNIGDLMGATKTLDKLTQLAPNNLRIKVENIRIKLAQNLNTDAKDAALALNKELPNNQNILVLLGDIETADQNMKQAYEYYWQATESDPKFVLPLLNLYQISASGLNAKRTESKLQKLADEFADESWRSRLLADHYTNQNQYEQALPIYLKLIESKQFAEDAAVLNNLANIYLESDLNKAREFALKANKLNSESPAMKDTLGWVYFKLDRYEEALQELRTAYSMDSSNPTIRYHLAEVLTKLGRMSEAKRELSVALLSSDGKPWAKDALALKELLEK